MFPLHTVQNRNKRNDILRLMSSVLLAMDERFICVSLHFSHDQVTSGETLERGGYDGELHWQYVWVSSVDL